MKYFKIITSKEVLKPIDEDELFEISKNINAGKKLILTSRGFFNVSFLDSIVIDKETMEYIQECSRYGSKYDIPKSPFKELKDKLSNKMKMLPDGEITAIDEKVAIEEKRN
jgi:hypothetical protein